MTLNPLATGSPAHYTSNLHFVQTPDYCIKPPGSQVPCTHRAWPRVTGVR
jgi:hypothetical protein